MEQRYKVWGNTHSRIYGIFICACHFKRAEEYNVRGQESTFSRSPRRRFICGRQMIKVLRRYIIYFCGTRRSARPRLVFNGRQRPFRSTQELYHDVSDGAVTKNEGKGERGGVLSVTSYSRKPKEVVESAVKPNGKLFRCSQWVFSLSLSLWVNRLLFFSPALLAEAARDRAHSRQNYILRRRTTSTRISDHVTRLYYSALATGDFIQACFLPLPKYFC